MDFLLLRYNFYCKALKTFFFSFFSRYVTAPEESFLQYPADRVASLDTVTTLIDSGVAAIEAVAEEQREARARAMGHVFRSG